MKLDIGIDCDGVICSTIDHLIDLAKLNHNIDFKIEDITDFYIDRIIPRGDELKTYFTKPSFYRHLELKDHAYETIQQLINEGNDVCVVTAIPDNCVPARSEWFSEKLPYMEKENIMYCKRKDKFYANVLLDDALHNLDSSIVDYPILFARPWNESGRDRYVTVYTWKEFYEVIRLIKKGLTYSELKEQCDNKKTA